MSEHSRWNPLPASLSVLVVAVLLGLPFLRVAPNRLVSGESVYFSSVAHGSVWLLLVILCAAALVAVFRPHRLWLGSVVASSVALITGLLWLAASHATFTAQGAASIARTSFGSAFWLAVVLLAFLANSALEQLRATALQRAALGVAVLLCLSAILGSGVCDNLSLVKEYTQRADDFGLLLARHMQIVLLALAFTVCLGLLSGWLAHAHAGVGRVVLPVLNII